MSSDLPVPSDEEPEGRVSRAGSGEGVSDPDEVIARYEKNAAGEVVSFCIRWDGDEYGLKSWVRCSIDDIIHFQE